MTDLKEQALGREKLSKLIVQSAVPSIIAQIINILYNIVDRMYIGHINEAGNLALTGRGITFPILTIISAFSAFAGSGGAPLAADMLSVNLCRAWTGKNFTFYCDF